MTPFEALYGRRCRILVCWDFIGQEGLLGLDIVQQTMDKIQIIKK